jgi:hypothetical protein
MSRKYTGWDGDAKGRRAGTEKFVQLTMAHFKNAVWNNGTWSVRAMKNSGPPKPSVHGTGRAGDLSWRKNGDKGVGRYELATQVVDFWVAYAEVLLIEEIHDYFPAPFGRGWRCDRSAWKVYDKQTIGSAPNGDWFHFEIAPTYADDASYYDSVFKGIADGSIKPNAPTAPVAKPAAAPVSGGLKFEYPGSPVKKGSKGDAVKLVQAIVGATPDGDFGAKTADAVKVWQKAKGLKPADGVVGPQTWAAMFG